jgi:Fe-Mn family superoxide dismutase
MALKLAAQRLLSIGEASNSASRGITTFKLPELSYDFGALEPYISGKIMELHVTKHHAAYVNNLNNALVQYAEAESKGDVAKMIALQGAIKFNGGGHVNHDIFWTNLICPKDFRPPSGELLQKIESQWKTLENFKTTLSAASAGVQGSGWGWLGYNKGTDRLEVLTLPNQDPLSTTGLVPLLGIDVWEHAYYLDYKNVRPDYLKAIWNVVNWKNVEERLAAAKK